MNKKSRGEQLPNSSNIFLNAFNCNFIENTHHFEYSFEDLINEPLLYLISQTIQPIQNLLERFLLSIPEYGDNKLPTIIQIQIIEQNIKYLINIIFN